jgi:hypothetical protein
MKHRNRLIAAVVSVGLLVMTGVAMSDDDRGKELLRTWFERTTPGIEPAESEIYVKECGGCHFPYQPGLLHALSWEKIMGGLDDHFGENAELDEGDQRTIRNFLLDNSAGRVNYGLPNKIMAAQGDRPLPIRVTEMRYFVYEHSELPRKMVQDNPKVKSFSNCDSCHQRAKQGLYDEHDVRIPGFGRWDD